MTTSLRGLAAGTLTVDVLTEGVHSGDASGVVPSSFRIARKLLDRLEDSANGWILPSAFHAQIPPERVEQAARAAAILGDIVFRKYPFAEGTRADGRRRRRGVAQSHVAARAVDDRRRWPAADRECGQRAAAVDVAQAVAAPAADDRRTRRDAGDEVIARSRSAARCAGDVRAGAGRDRMERAARRSHGSRRRADSASRAFYGKPSAAMGEGGTIPFMAMLGEQFPDAQFLITGVLGPHSNAHGPNEFLHIEYAKRLTACVAEVIAAHAAAG